MKKVRKIVGWIIGVLVVFFLPYVFLMLSTKANIVKSIDALPTSDAVIVFGTIVRGDTTGDLSPLMIERLQAGKMIYDVGKTKQIVVSNTEQAAHIMKEYLVGVGVNSGSISIDPTANTTVDTCIYEKNTHPGGRSVIFVSQSFHLPRIVYQCHREGVAGVSLVADALGIIDRSQYDFWTKAWVRGGRLLREAVFDRTAVMEAY